MNRERGSKMWGAAIGYIILGAAQYKFRKQLRMNPSKQAETIGFAFWWGGWIALLWWIVITLTGLPNSLKMIGLVLMTFWVGIRALITVSQILERNK
jgi:apolipoprotein N-acyltransferase